ncbi:MAG: cation transporter [Kiritimatiellales bacterium]|nr:cation transporter [Kiritimatiellales bacterium]
MRHILTACIAITLLTAVAGCFRNEIQVTEYKVHMMTKPAAASYIQQKIQTIDGVVEISYDLATTTLVVTYDSDKIRKMNIEEAIAMSGFDVNNRPANAAAKAKLMKGLL